MATAWSDVAASAAFQALTPDEQEEARQQYFDDVVAPQVGEGELEDVRSMFDTDTMLSRSAPGQHSVPRAPVEPAEEEDLPLGEAVVRSAKRGWASLKELVPTLGATGNALALQQMDAVDRGEITDPKELGVLAEQYWNTKPIDRAEFRTRWAEHLPGRIATDVQKIAKLEADKRALPGSRATQEVMAADSFKEAAAAIARNPIQFLADVGPESLVSSAPGIVGAIPATAIAGPGGGAALLGANSFAVDMAQTMMSELNEIGIDTTNPQALSGALNNPIIMQPLIDKIVKRAAVVGGVDAISGGVASKTLLPNKLANFAVQTPIQGALGGAGEAAGQLAAGEEIRPGDVLAEAVGELAGAPAEVAAMSVRGAEQKVPQVPQAGATNHTPPESLSAQMGLTPIVVPNVSPAVKAQVAQEFGFDKLQEQPNVSAGNAVGPVVGEVRTQAGPDAAGGLADPGPALAVGGQGPVAAGAPVVSGQQDGSVSGEATQSAAAVETWVGRRGDGYVTQPDAQQALPGRQRMHPELAWKIEQLPSGKYRLAGYSAQKPAPVPAQATTPAASGELDAAAHDAATSPTNDLPEPTDAQKEAGNYKKGHVRVQGLDITIENPQGSIRRSKADAKEPWQVTMPAHYGYFRGTEGADGDHIDVTLGSQPGNEALPVFVFDQTNEAGKFDEHKVFVGFANEADARSTYRSSFAGDFGKKMESSLIGVRKFTPGAFKEWLARDDHSQPASGGTRVAEAPQAVQTEAQGSQVPGAAGIVAAVEAKPAATQELPSPELEGLKLAPPAPASVVDGMDTQLRRLSNVEIEQVPQKSMSVGHRVASSIARVFGKTLTVVKQRSGKPNQFPNGFINGFGGKHIFIADNTEDAPLSVVVHEIYHSLPAAQRVKLNAALLGLTHQDRRAEFAEQYSVAEKDVEEELPAYIVQALSKSDDFWQELREKMGNKEFAEVARVILDKLNELLSGFSKSYGDEFLERYVKDVKRARDLLTDAYAVAVRGETAPAEEAEVAFANREEIGEYSASVEKDGSFTIEGDVDEVRSLLPEGVTGRATQKGLKFRNSDAPRVRAALAGRKVAYGRGGEVTERLAVSDGKYVGAPEKFNTPAKVSHLRKFLKQLAREGKPGRFWYENSSAEVLRMVGGDLREARKFAALLAIYSPQAKVDTNATFALRAWAQHRAGQPINVKTKVMDRKAEEALSDVDAFWGGEKTGNFVTNLLRRIDPSLKQGATIDMWMMRAAQYKSDVPTSAQYAFMENEVNRLARELDWEPQQVQAAIWVAMKARMENADVKKRTEAKSEKKGWLRYETAIKDGKPKRVRKILNKDAHRSNWMAHAFARTPTKKDTAAAKFDFGDGLRRHIGQISFEARPGRSTAVLPGVHGAPYFLQLKFQQDVQKALYDKDGVDLLAQKLGLLVDSEVIAPGVWQGEVSPSSQKSVAMAPGKADANESVDPAQRQALDVYASVLGLLARQEGVGWHRPFYTRKVSEHNGIRVDIGRPLHPTEAADLEKSIAGWLSENGRNATDLAFISEPKGIRIVNFGAVSNDELRKQIVELAEGVLPDFEYQSFKADGDMPTNDWKENPNGQGYVQRASAAGRSDVLDWARSVLAPRVQSVFERYSEAYDWGDPGEISFSNRLAKEASEGEVAPVFYSALTRAAEQLKLTKASEAQWLGTLRNQPGVKEEELEWSGLREWLFNIGRQATKQEVVDFLRANELQIKEVLKGEGPAADPEEEAIVFRVDDAIVSLTALGAEPEPIVRNEDGKELFHVTHDNVTYEYMPRENALVADVYNTSGSLMTLKDQQILAATKEWYDAAKAKAAFYDRRREIDYDDRPDSDVKYARYTTPGGRNYRELLLTLPVAPHFFEVFNYKSGKRVAGFDTREEARTFVEEERPNEPLDWAQRDSHDNPDQYHSSHWDEPNILAHVRFDERTDQDGKRVLFVQEIQSDWHQQGRKRGYKGTPATVEERAEYEALVAKMREVGGLRGTDVDRMQALGTRIRNDGVPDAPFKTTWPELAFKRVLRWAAEGDFDRVAWTTGEQQAERYDLGTVLDSIQYAREGDKWRVRPYAKEDPSAIANIGILQVMTEEQIEEHYGKEIRQKIVNGDGEQLSGRFKDGYKKLSGIDLRVGAEGMIGFYDQMLPKIAGKLTKKWGGKVTKTYLKPSGESRLLSNDSAEEAAAIGASPVHALDITPELREAALAGQPVFSNRMRGEQKQTATSAFKRWFGDSKVVDESGEPLRVYHGSRRGNIRNFNARKNKYGFEELGSHFGSAVAANDRLEDRGGGGVVYPTHLSIKKPLRLPDLGTWGALEVARAIEDNYPKEFSGLFEDVERFDNSFDDKDMMPHLRKRIQAGGYDGIVYLNRGEGFERDEEALSSDRWDGTLRTDEAFRRNHPDASDSWIALAPAQVKSAIGNEGSFDPESANIVASNRQAPPWQRPWIFDRDELGRFRFAAGARAYRVVADLANVVLDKLKLKPISKELGKAMRRMHAEIAAAKERAAEVAGKLQALTPEERELISDVIENELRVGITPPQKILAIAANMQHIMSEQTKQLVELGMITDEAANRWEGKYLPRFYQKQFKDELKAWARAAKQLFGRKGAMQGITGNSLKARGLFKDIPIEELPAYEQNGWEVRDPGFDPAESDQVTIWRDFTKEERAQMNEIRDSMFRFVMGYMRSQKDIALGRLYRHIADTMASRSARDGYVQVPDTSIEGTTAKRYGKLAGKWVPQEVMDHLSAADSSEINEIFKVYLKGLSAWKEGRTVLNPVSHVNNIISNVTMAHMAGVSYWDGHKYALAVRDLVKGSAMVTEAKEAGLFGGTFNQADLMNSMPEQLRVLAGMSESTASRWSGNIWTALTFWLRKPMQKAYEGEDLFFRYVIYRDARKRGLSPDDAVSHAQEYIFTYDDLPKGARALRDTVVPFFSWTYKAVPALSRTAFEYPWRFAAPAAILYGANAAMYAIATAQADGDEGEWWELIGRYILDPEFRGRVRDLQEQEQRDLPAWNKGRTAIGTPKVVRMWQDDVTNLPMFLDVSRLMPGGDMFDTENNAGGIPWFAPIDPGGPAVNILFGMFGNLDYFTGKNITSEADTDVEAAEKRASWMYQSLAPSIAPFGYHFNRTMNAVAYATDTTIDLGPVEYTGFGKDGLPVQPSLAALQLFGIKLRTVDLEQSRAIADSQRQRLVRDINSQIAGMKRLRKNGAISDEAYEEQLEQAREKKARLKQGLTVEGEEEE